MIADHRRINDLFQILEFEVKILISNCSVYKQRLEFSVHIVSLN